MVTSSLNPNNYYLAATDLMRRVAALALAVRTSLVSSLTSSFTLVVAGVVWKLGVAALDEGMVSVGAAAGAVVSGAAYAELVGQYVDAAVRELAVYGVSEWRWSPDAGAARAAASLSHHSSLLRHRFASAAPSHLILCPRRCRVLRRRPHRAPHPRLIRRRAPYVRMGATTHRIGLLDTVQGANERLLLSPPCGARNDVEVQSTKVQVASKNVNRAGGKAHFQKNRKENRADSTQQIVHGCADDNSAQMQT
ncbi:hypothetical protein C8J57DRAFT_1503885 [Mycena rebaudengoi]|nr:hypothetical protein C8J57DRAFT_1503885 [Mycena rebaudengoi]